MISVGCPPARVHGCGPESGIQNDPGSSLSFVTLWRYSCKAFAQGWNGIPCDFGGSIRIGEYPNPVVGIHAPFPICVLPRFGVPSLRRGAGPPESLPPGAGTRPP